MIRISLSTVGLFYLRNFPALDHNQRAFSMGRTVRETEKHILCPVHQLSNMAESGRMRQSNAIERVRYYGRIKCLWVARGGKFLSAPSMEAPGSSLLLPSLVFEFQEGTNFLSPTISTRTLLKFSHYFPITSFDSCF